MEIARDLMTPDGREIGASLRIFDSRLKYVAGWSLAPLADRIEKHLTGAINAKRKSTKVDR